MNPEPAAELAFLRAALTAHLEGLLDTGAEGVPACDEATLSARRTRYREVAREVDEQMQLEGERPEASRAPPPSGPTLLPTPPPNAPPAAPAANRTTPQASPVTAELPAPTRAPAETRTASVRPDVTVDRADARARLKLLQEEVRSCTRCDLHQTRTQTVFARGSEKSGVCFIGEGPGADEDAQGLPFVGAAGQLLDKMIAGMGLGRDDVYVCNIVKCRPPKNRKPERQEIQACRDYLAEQIELVAPRVIVALGGTALEGLLGLRGIQRLRGQWRLYRGQIPVMPTFHPAYLLREPAAKRLAWSDLKLVLEHLGLSAPDRH